MEKCLSALLLRQMRQIHAKSGNIGNILSPSILQNCQTLQIQISLMLYVTSLTSLSSNISANSASTEMRWKFCNKFMRNHQMKYLPGICSTVANSYMANLFTSTFKE